MGVICHAYEGGGRVTMDSWPRCERAIGFIATTVGAAFLALAGFLLYQADYSIPKGFIALLITGGVGMAVGLFMFLNVNRRGITTPIGAIRR